MMCGSKYRIGVAVEKGMLCENGLLNFAEPNTRSLIPTSNESRHSHPGVLRAPLLCIFSCH